MKTDAIFSRPPEDSVQHARALGVSGFGVRWQHLRSSLVAHAHAAGLGVRGWAANDAQAYRRCVELGVDGITTDYPDRLLAFLERAD